jgi:ADP-ribose pyrophosphatase YjhB (NUDIX family)
VNRKKEVNTCDNSSVGVIITRRDGRFLIFDRNTFPMGAAPVAGHVFDEHTDYECAAYSEVAEEVGLKITALTHVTKGWRGNCCRRPPGPRGVGHEWVVFAANVTGDLRPSHRETRNVRWLTATELKTLAERTVSYARGSLSDAEFSAVPGIEPVWVAWFVDAGIVTLPNGSLSAVDRLLTATPCS